LDRWIDGSIDLNQGFYSPARSTVLQSLEALSKKMGLGSHAMTHQSELNTASSHLSFGNTATMAWRHYLEQQFKNHSNIIINANGLM